MAYINQDNEFSLKEIRLIHFAQLPLQRHFDHSDRKACCETMILKKSFKPKSAKTERVTESKFLDERLLQKALPKEIAPFLSPEHTIVIISIFSLIYLNGILSADGRMECCSGK